MAPLVLLHSYRGAPRAAAAATYTEVYVRISEFWLKLEKERTWLYIFITKSNIRTYTVYERICTLCSFVAHFLVPIRNIAMSLRTHAFQSGCTPTSHAYIRLRCVCLGVFLCVHWLNNGGGVPKKIIKTIAPREMTQYSSIWQIQTPNHRSPIE